ncbi:hypothetical protein AWB80_07526 [Caballeronia pedi]|uniref:Uncharacterized protein n=1 Tax=Caballeronia pedi TaxID=1777141 RepID=A0A158DV13_9BURK|nr:hypothetical protein [Caballeronia pedi]SAK98462.1 hypothetical protein AWB80_07526 [Caballeronia pedi]
MTDRIHSLTVVLDENMRADDAEQLINAIRMMRGVADVAGNIAEHSHYVAETRVRRDLSQKLWAVLHPESAT